MSSLLPPLMFTKICTGSSNGMDDEDAAEDDRDRML